ncbi:MAG: ABC transporter ATP-binding protein [Coriobacteriales bacterium]|jgi:ABC-2 type transport system ATP-binding protein|nr:ABC transporter ATP-binding protein [Coriobacteriales bacterium]
MPEEYVQVEHLVKRYGDVVAVDDLSFSVHPGEIFGFLGPNGAGKSTTINVLVGLTKWNSGQIRVAGHDLAHEAKAVKAQIGLVPQEIALYRNLPAKRNVEYFASLYGLHGKALKEAVAEALAFVGLSEQADRRVSKLSGGMQRRLNIACGIAHHPKLIVMDEPTVGVDPQSREHILAGVKTLRERGATVIYTSHYMPEVQEICDRIAIVDHGKLIGCGSERELLALVTDQKRIRVEFAPAGEEASAELVKRVQLLPDIRTAALDREQPSLLNIDAQVDLADYSSILSVFIELGLPIKQITSEAPDLETTFLALTGRELRS